MMKNREEQVAPWTEFESVSKPRQGFMIGHYTTRAVKHHIKRWYLMVSFSGMEAYVRLSEKYQKI